MNDVTRILSAIEEGNPSAAAELLPLVYDELRKLAAARLAQEKPGQTLQATALVHEAYLRLVAGHEERHWNSRSHFFIAAAEAMRRLLVENARRKGRQKRGGDFQRQAISVEAVAGPAPNAELLAVDEALDKLESTNRTAAELVKLRYFAGYTIPETAEKLGISPRKADQIWAYARSWLMAEISKAEQT